MRRTFFCVFRVVFAAVAFGAATDWVGEAKAQEGVVALPPFLVDATKGSPWHYARSPEFEILSRCPDAAAQEIAQSYHRLQQVLNVVLPPPFQVKLDVPKTLILYDETLLPATAQEMLAETGGTSPGSPDELRYNVLRNPWLSDRDAVTVFVSVPREMFKPGRLAGSGIQLGWTSLTPSYIGFLLGNRSPALPSWFVSGFVGLYGRMSFTADAIQLGAVEGFSADEARVARNRPRPTVALLTMPELFAGPRGDATHTRLWFPQAELFIRWALDNAPRERQAAFWTFLDRSCTQPPSEKLFTECFGFGFDRMRELLQTYLPRAMLGGVTWRAPAADKLPPLEFREATASEVALFKGDWERLATTYVRSNSPALADRYLDQARRTLRRAYDRGDRDPRLLAVLGLCECDADNGSGARRFLEEAVQGGVVRPRAYLELAKLRWAEERAKGGRGGKLNPVQTESVLAPLMIARKQAPALAEVYELMAEVWSNSAVTPQRADLAALAEGVGRFPQRAELLYRAAVLFSAQGMKREATILAEAGERVAPNEAALRRFAELLEDLAAP